MQANQPVGRIIRLAAIIGALTSVSACMAQGYGDPNAPVDPPGRVARISVLQGEVSLEPAGANGFSQAELNYPLTIGDRVYVDLQALSELETAGLAVRMSNGADLTLSNLTDAVAQFGLAQGSIRVSSREIPAPDGSSGVIEIDTPNGTVWVRAPGDIRIDTYPQSNQTVVSVTSGQVEIAGPELDETLGPDEAIQLSGTNPVRAQFVGSAAPDDLDDFDQVRERQYQNTVAQESEYVSPDMIGGEDLASYGAWAPDPSYGVVWYPRGVREDWVPYHNGRWVYIQPWGWTWVESEPWGFAPFHYGRWVDRDGRWGWIPGPPPAVFAHPVRPIYSPALVGFIGGPGLGVTAWFPLGPGEPYVPSYTTSIAYVNRVNATNIYNRNSAQVRAGMSNRTANLYGGEDRNRVYANRNAGISAVNRNDFEAGRNVDRAQPVRLDSNLRQQLNRAPVAARPTATPTVASMQQPPARALPPIQARPQLPGRGTGGRGNMDAAPNRNAARTDRPVLPAPANAPAQRGNTPPPNVPQPRIYAPPANTSAPTPTPPVEFRPEARPAQPMPPPAEPRPSQPQPDARPREQQPAPQQPEPDFRQRQMPPQQQQLQQPERQQQLQRQQLEQQQQPRPQPVPQYRQVQPAPQQQAPRPPSQPQAAPFRPVPRPARPAEPPTKDPPRS